MSIFEIAMLVCFGVSWPISISKAIKTKVVQGKSPLFMAIVCVGYLSGTVHKAVYSRDPVIFLYILNFFLVATDLFLYYRYLPLRQQK
jgi:hypothetical protein